jgi:fatty acid amide hydrolase
VARLRAAGAIVLGKTNVSQLLIYTEADNPLFGRTNNPWNATRSCGGSSGGEGAIIAAGGSPLGLGTDIGGSVRVPAASCGICSLKPTAGRLPDLGRYSVPLGQQAIPSQIGVLARHVDDVALGIEVANGGRQPPGPPLVALGDYRQVPLQGLRVGYYTEDDSFAPAPAVQRAVTQAATLLREAGATVQSWTPPSSREALRLFGGILTADGGAGLRRALDGSRRAPQVAQLLAVARLPAAVVQGLRGLLRALGQTGLAENLEMFGDHSVDAYWSRLERQFDFQQRFAAALDGAEGGPVDVLLAPVGSLPAFTHGSTRDLLTAGGYATLYNLLGYPAGVVPVTRVRSDEESARPASRDLIARLARQVEQGSTGLPVGVQVIARPWQEHLALAAMRAIETAARRREGFPLTPIDPQ